MAFTTAAGAETPAGVIVRALSDEDGSVFFVVADVAQVVPTLDVIRAGDSMITMKAVNALDHGHDLFSSADSFAPIISARKLFTSELGETEPADSDDLAARITTTLGVDGDKLLSDLRISSPPDSTSDTPSLSGLTDSSAPAMIIGVTVPELSAADAVSRLLHGTALIDRDGDLWFAVAVEDHAQAVHGLDPDRVAELVDDEHRCVVASGRGSRHPGLSEFDADVSAAACVDTTGLLTLSGSETSPAFTAWLHSPRPARVIENSAPARAAMSQPRTESFLTLSECADHLGITPVSYALALCEIKALDKADSSANPWTTRNPALLTTVAHPEHSAGPLWVPVVKSEDARDQLTVRLRARGLVG